MNRRERVLAAQSQQQPDRVPIDWGAPLVTGISAKAYDWLMQYLDLALWPTQIYDRASQLAVVDELLLERFGVEAIVLRLASSFIQHAQILRGFSDTHMKLGLIDTAMKDLVEFSSLSSEPGVCRTLAAGTASPAARTSRLSYDAE